MTQIFKVLSQGNAFAVQKQDGTSIQKSTLVLQLPGGKFEDSFVCTLLGEQALQRYCPGDLVVAALRFRHSEHGSNVYQDVTVQDIQRLTASLPPAIPLSAIS